VDRLAEDVEGTRVVPVGHGRRHGRERNQRNAGRHDRHASREQVGVAQMGDVPGREERADHLVDERVALRDQGGDRGGNESGEHASPEADVGAWPPEPPPWRRKAGVHGALRDGACQGATTAPDAVNGARSRRSDDVDRREPGGRVVAEGVERAEDTAVNPLNTIRRAEMRRIRYANAVASGENPPAVVTMGGPARSAGSPVLRP
jgi:hypothetical protein